METRKTTRMTDFKFTTDDLYNQIIEHPQIIATVIEGEKNYRNSPFFSNSDLGVFKKETPRTFKLYKEEEWEETSSGFKLGTLFETYLLEPIKFKKKYILCEVESPSNAHHQGYCADRIAGEAQEIAYGNHYSTKNKSENQIKNKIKELEADYKKYIDFKIKAKDKIEYNIETSKLLSDMKAAIGTHQLASRLLVEEHDEFVDVFTQLALRVRGKGYPLKGMLDRLVVDHERKQLWIPDLKTTSKSLGSFGYWAKRYRYTRQIAIYTILAMLFIKDFYGPEQLNIILDEWEIIPCLIPVKTTGVIECKVVRVPNIALEEGLQEALDIMKEIKWHVKEDKWRHNRNYYENNGLEELEYEPDGDISPEESEEVSGGGLAAVTTA